MEGVFTAGDGDLSIVFQSAAHLWGSWGATYSEGVEAEDFEEDRTRGFVGDVGDTGGELASRMWVRADVAMDQDAQTSTVPQVFRDARERTSGEVVVQREVSGLGLGRLVPYVHFRHGDEIGTVVGSKVVPLPVNSIEYTTDLDGKTDYVVTVGKGLLGNTRERDARNAVLEAQIRRETAERDRRIAEEAKREAEKAVRPINTDLDKALDLYNGGKLGIGKDSRFTWVTEQGQLADGVIQGNVNKVGGEVENVRRGVLGEAQDRQYTTLGGMNQIGQVLRDNFLNRYYQDENGRTRNMLTSSQLSQAEAGLIPAYVTMNNIMWEQQMLVNAVHSEAIEALRRSVFSVTYMSAGQTASTTDGFLRFSPPNFGQIPQRIGFTRLNSRWRGKIVILVNYLQQTSIPPDFRVQVYERTHTSFGSGTYFTLDIGVGDVQNITFFHRTDNPDEL